MLEEERGTTRCAGEASTSAIITSIAAATLVPTFFAGLRP
jgi:hypothetical protein